MSCPTIEKPITDYALLFSTLNPNQKDQVHGQFLAKMLEWLAQGSKQEVAEVDASNKIQFKTLEEKSSLCGKVAKWALSFFEPLIRALFWSFNADFAKSLQPFTPPIADTSQSSDATLLPSAKTHVNIDAFTLDEILDCQDAALQHMASIFFQGESLYDVQNQEQCQKAAIFLKKSVITHTKNNPVFNESTLPRLKKEIREWSQNPQLPQKALALFSQAFAAVKRGSKVEELILTKGMPCFNPDEIQYFSVTQAASALTALDKRRQESTSPRYFTLEESPQIAALIDRCIGTKAMDLKGDFEQSIAIAVIQEFREYMGEIERTFAQAKQQFDEAIQRWIASPSKLH